MVLTLERTANPMKKLLFISTPTLVFSLFLFTGCGSSKSLEKEMADSQKSTDSTITALDQRLQEFSREVQAMRATYNEDHKTLEDLYRLNAESRSELKELGTSVDSQLVELREEQTENQGDQQIQMLRVDSTFLTLKQSMSNMREALAVTQFQVDSLYTQVDPAHLEQLEKNLMDVQNTVSRLDSTMIDYRLGGTDVAMATDDKIRTLEQHARVQDSANYDILSQLVLLENKIISLTNAFNELMAMPPGEIKASEPEASTPAPVVASTTGTMEYETYKQHYIDALSDYQNKEFLSAIDQFQMLLRTDSSNDYADNAQYWIGESYYALEDYDRAIQEFRKVLNFGDSNKADAAQFKIGYSYINMGDKTSGFRELRRILELFPDSPYIDKVQEILNAG